jgi:hypothetical protein
LDCLLGEVKRDTPHPLIAVQKAFFCNNAYIPGVKPERHADKAQVVAGYDFATPDNVPIANSAP